MTINELIHKLEIARDLLGCGEREIKLSVDELYTDGPLEGVLKKFVIKHWDYGPVTIFLDIEGTPNE